jgi:hypothetical protein
MANNPIAAIEVIAAVTVEIAVRADQLQKRKRHPQRHRPR